MVAAAEQCVNGAMAELRTWLTVGARRSDTGGAEDIGWREWRAFREELEGNTGVDAAPGHSARER